MINWTISQISVCWKQCELISQTCANSNFSILNFSNSDIWKTVRSVFILTRMRTVWARIFAIDFAKTFVSDALFVHFDVILNVAIEKLEHFDNIDANVAKKIDDSCDENEHAIVDFFFVLHVELTVLIKRNEQMTNFFACCSRLCSRNDFLKLKVSSQCLHVTSMTSVVWNNAISIDFDIVSNVKIEKFERFSRMIVLNAIANSNIDFRNLSSEADDLCETDDVFLVSHTKLTALIEK